MSWEEVFNLPKKVKAKEKKAEPKKVEENKERGADMAVFSVLLAVIIFVVLMMLLGIIK